MFCLLVFASPGPFTELGSADGKPLSATSAPAAGCVIHTLVYYITFSPCAQLFCPVSAEKLTCFRRIPFSSPMLFYRLIVFNGRGKLRSPLAPHRTSSSSCSGVPVGLFSEKALQLFLQNARPSAAVRPPMGGGSFSLPLLRTEPALRAAPVFRSAYFPKKLFSFFSKTLDLQPLCGLRWAGEASLPPAPLSPVPAVLIFPLCKRRRICFQTDRQDAAAPECSSFRCQDSIPVISRQPALRRLTFPAARPAPQSGRRRRRCRSKA